MAGADHCRQCFLPGVVIAKSLCKWADPLAPGEGDGGIPAPVGDTCLGDFGVAVLDSRESERLADPALAIAPPLQPGGARTGKGGIVDIAKISHFADQCVDIRLRAFFHPAAIADFSA